MHLFTYTEYQRLLANGRETDQDHRPVAKFYIPGSGGMTWLITAIDPVNPRFAQGLEDLGHGFPQYGRIDLKDFVDIPMKYDLPFEKDDCFQSYFPVSVYIAAAQDLQYIVEDYGVLARYVRKKKGPYYRPL